MDAVLLRAYHEFVKQPAERDIGGWLIELAKEQLRREVKRLKSERNRTVHIEEDIPETPPTEEVSTLGEEILDFYQPDEDLKLEDIFPDVEVSTPEELASLPKRNCCAASTRPWRGCRGNGAAPCACATPTASRTPSLRKLSEVGAGDRAHS